MQPPGSLPGISSLAIAPAMPPMMIQTIQPFASSRPMLTPPVAASRESADAVAAMNTNASPQGKCHR